MTKVYDHGRFFLRLTLMRFYEGKVEVHDPRLEPVTWAGKAGFFTRERYQQAATVPDGTELAAGISAASWLFGAIFDMSQTWPAQAGRVFPGEHAYFVVSSQLQAIDSSYVINSPFYVFNYLSPPGMQGAYWREFKQMVETFQPR